MPRLHKNHSVWKILWNLPRGTRSQSQSQRLGTVHPAAELQSLLRVPRTGKQFRANAAASRETAVVPYSAL